MNYKDITVIITTFKSEKKIFSCLDSLPTNIKAIVVENSNNLHFKELIESKYRNLECILTGSNKGYSVGNNLGLSQVNTKYALLLNPDTTVEKNAIENFLNSAVQHPDFWLIGPTNNQRSQTYNNQIFEVENLKGFAMFFNIYKFNNIFFDENYFLYFEEIDLCKQIKNKKGKIFSDPKIKINHEGAGSVNKQFKEELEKNRNWHWMWSTFYFHKKYKGFPLALIIILPKLISSFFKIIFFQLFLNVKKRDIYFYRLSGILNSILGKKSWYRPTLD